MVSSSSAQQRTHDDAASNERRLSKGRVVPASQCLAKQTYYLDVKNATAAGELEKSIKHLGGSLELFLVKEVSLVVTDRKECPNGNRGAGSHPRTPQTPSAPSNQQQDASVGEQVTPRGRPKTRADAMLERVWNTPTQQQPAAPSGHVLEQAKAWGVPIWSVDKALTWLKQLLADSEKSGKCKVVHLKGHCIKFEAFGRLQRPVFKEIRNWPYANVRGASGTAAVLHRPIGDAQIMTKARNPQHPLAKVDAPAQSGYCEICRGDYDNLSAHLASKRHLLYVNNNSNYTSLDALIANGTDLQTFLSANGSRRTGLVASRVNSALALHKMPKTRISSSHECNGTKAKNGHISPAEDGEFRLLRARKSTMTYIALTPQDPDEETQAELAEDNLPFLHCRELRSRTALSKIPDDTWKSGRPKRSCINRNRPTYLDDTILASEQRGFYRVEMTPKVRTSVVSPAVDESALKKASRRESCDCDPEHMDAEKSLIVKFKRMRSSELRMLNDEAENFLFPKVKEDASSDTDIDMNCPETTISTQANDSIVISSERDCEEGEEAHVCDHSPHSDCKKRKRLTQAEAFIEDNKKYYKFETPGTRLRYQGSVPHEPAAKRIRRNGDLHQTPDNPKSDDCKFTLDELQFSFETVPKSEPWYETFSRQDHGAEYYTCFSDSGYWKKFLLPYEMERIPPLDPKVCIETYAQIKKLFALEASSGTSDCSTQGSPAPFIDETSKASEDGDKPKISVLPAAQRKSDLGGTSSRNPRKSPRQHASTLAILSSLIQHRKKRKLSNANTSLDAIPESGELAPTRTPDDLDEPPEASISKVAASIDEMLANAFGDVNDIEVPLAEAAEDAIGFTCKSDAIAVLEDYENLHGDRRKPASKASGRRAEASPRKSGRKRKKNRTGWPKHSAKRTSLKLARAKKEDANGTRLEQGETGPAAEGGEALPNSANSNVNSKRLSVAEDDETGWDNADKVLSTQTSNSAILADGRQCTPERNKRNRRMQGSSSPQARHPAKRARRMPASPKSPRVLRKPRGRWYRER